MKKKTPRAICLEILNQLERTDRHLDHLLNDSLKRYRHLTPFDRGFLTELAYGVLRWREKLDWTIRAFSKIPFEKIEKETLNILRLGLYQIEFLTRTPVSAAVNESVELAKKVRGSGGGGFVNAILRTYLRKRKEIIYPDPIETPDLYLSVLYSHPLWLVQRWIEELGVEETLKICEFNNRISPLTLRANTLKVTREELMERFKEKGLKPVLTHFSPEGIQLDDPPPTSELPYLHEGLFFIQDEASQLVTSVLDPQRGETILDACAAPGGKTTHIAQKMENHGELYAIDLAKEKLSLIEENCQRLGIKIVRTLKGDASHPISFFKEVLFDRILADVPCSGFGTIRKNPDLKWKKKEADLRRLSTLQLRILQNLSAYLKKEGILVYSTCTVFQEENEQIVEQFLNDHPDFELQNIGNLFPKRFDPLIQNGYLKTFPPKEGMDGFFIARLIKTY